MSGRQGVIRWFRIGLGLILVRFQIELDYVAVVVRARVGVPAAYNRRLDVVSHLTPRSR